MKITSFQSLCRKTGLTLVSSLTLATVATAQPDKAHAAALNLSFANPVEANNTTDPFIGNFPAYSGQVIDFKNVVTTNGVTVNARITANVFGSGYSFVDHIPKYTAQGSATSATETAFVYKVDPTSTGKGGLTYKIDFFNNATNAAYTLPDIRLNVYDVDGDPSQSEAIRVAKGTGLVGYQIANNASAVTATEEPTSYLFSGKGTNVTEGVPNNGAAVLYFQNVNSVTLTSEANTTASNGAENPVYTGIDGDLSLISQATLNNTSQFKAVVSTASTATAVPEPFTIIGTIIGGTAAVRMRKKLKASTKA